MENKPNCPRSIVGLLAALPFLIPQLVYLSDIHGWNVALSYGLIFVALVAPFVLLLIYGAIEKRIRNRLASVLYRTPWFSIFGLVFVISFFFMGPAVRPLVLQIPDWCRVHQVVRWETSMPNEESSGMHHYVLVLIGRGNTSEHEFVSGYLNWTGDKPAGFSSIKPNKEILSHSGGVNYSAIPLSIAAIQDRTHKSGLPEEEAQRISKEIFDVITQARAHETIRAESGVIEPLWEAPFDQEDTILGASIWIVLLLGSFQLVAFQTIPPARPKAEQVD